ncbi:MAG: hypothetical protein B7X04_02065 [Parcubacteria group bacterium 21-54-25]|nr:MAG: hypothetical protein B7X04_02065 [Parcubacteria group bacterium 21-54-25]
MVALLIFFAIFSSNGCAMMGGNHEFGPVRVSEIPIMKPLVDGPVTRTDQAMHRKIFDQCRLVVNDIRGSAVKGGVRRAFFSAVAGGAGGGFGGYLYNITSDGASMLIKPLMAMYAAITGVTMVPSWEFSYRDENMNLDLTCVRDGESSKRIVWYSPEEVKRLLHDPAKYAAFQRAFRKGMTEMENGGQAFWPPYQK